MSSISVHVDKATSEFLYSPDWTINMEICDSINSDIGQAKEAMKSLKKRIQHKSSTVQLLALTLLETIIKNCGEFVHFHVAERNILEEMMKIVKKKSDMRVRDKVLELLDSWQEAFGGPGGKHPQYYYAYEELRRSGVQFPPRSADTVPIFTPPATRPAVRTYRPSYTMPASQPSYAMPMYQPSYSMPVNQPNYAIPAHQPGYGMPMNSTRRLDEAMASERAQLSYSDLDTIEDVADLLADMLRALNPNDGRNVRDEVIVDLVSQCQSNQRRLMQLVNVTVDEKQLERILALNDSIQGLLAKHDAIARCVPLLTSSADLSSSSSNSSAPVAHPPPIVQPPPTTGQEVNNEEEEDDDFSQLARRRSKAGVASETADTDTTTPSSSIYAGPLALPAPPQPVRISPKEPDFIDLLNINLSTANISSPHTPVDSSRFHVPSPTVAESQFSPSVRGYSPHGLGHAYTHGQVPPSANSSGHAYAEGQVPFNGNNSPRIPIQGKLPYNNYVAPWAQQVPSSYIPPPWSTPVPGNGSGSAPVTQQDTVASPRSPLVSNSSVPLNALVPKSSSPLYRQPRRSNGDTRTNTPSFVPSYKLFDDLVDMSTYSHSTPKSNGSSSSLSRNSMAGQDMPPDTK